MKSKISKFLSTGRLLSILIASIMLLTSCSTSGVDSGSKSGGGAYTTKDGSTAYQIGAGLPDPALFIANQNSDVGTSTFGGYAFEGLIRYQRGSDDIALQLAESYEHVGNKTIFKLHPNIKWSDGEPFTSKDIWAFYQICLNSPVNYLESIETPDDLTVEFVWQEPVPSEEIRIMLIAQEVHHGRIPYHIYHEFIDKGAEILAKFPDLTDEQKAQGIRGPYGKDNRSDKDLVAEWDENWQNYRKTPPNKDHIIVGTGPYINDTGHTKNEGSMSKNPHYWNPDKQRFDKIIIKATTDVSKTGMLKSGELDWVDGTMPKDLTESLLDAVDGLVYYPMEDPACMGLNFNIESKTSPMDKKEFRQALNYIANKEALRDIGSYQSKIHEYAYLGIPPSLLDKYVSKEVIDKLRRYNHDEAKAKELLESIGCTLKNGKWHNPDGTPIKLTIGVNKDWAVGTLTCPIYANQLKDFGLDCEVMAVEGSVFVTQAEQENVFDMTFEWVDISWSFSYPYFPLKTLYERGGPAKRHKFPFKEENGRETTTLKLTDWDGNEFDVWQWISDMLTEEDQDICKDRWERIIWATNENAFGINFFQNVTGAWERMDRVDGLPMTDKVTENGWMPFPETTEEKIATYNLNHGFSGEIRKIWMLGPKK